MSKNDIETICCILEKEFSVFNETELLYENCYQLLVAILLSAQAQDVVVNKVTDTLFKIVKKPEDAIEFGFEKINNCIKMINHHNTKAKHIVELSEKIVNEFNGKIPDNFNDLVSLPGVGRKTANLFLSLVYKKPYIAVDTHVFRVSNRLGIVDAKNTVETEKQLMKKTPVKRYRDINSLFIPFGRKYCKSHYPKCAQCPLKTHCKKYNTSLKDE